jgi:hypothetical protein
METLQAEDKTWTLSIDSDEYLLYNPHSLRSKRLADERGRYTILDTLNTAAQHVIMGNSGCYPMSMAMQSLGSTIQERPCILFKRLKSGTKESSGADILDQVPIPLQALSKDMETLRWRWHAGLKNRLTNKIAKGMWVPELAVDVHLPVKQLCDEKDLWKPASQSHFLVHHYQASTARLIQFKRVRER